MQPHRVNSNFRYHQMMVHTHRQTHFFLDMLQNYRLRILRHFQGGS
ncbi:MAG: hypothetical protein ACK56F_30850 [bacterium]